MAEKKSTPTAKPSLATKAEIGEYIEQQRRRLFGADAVIICIQRGIDSMQAPPDEIRVGDALQVASNIINRVATELGVLAEAHGFTSSLDGEVRPGDPEGVA